MKYQNSSVFLHSWKEFTSKLDLQMLCCEEMEIHFSALVFIACSDSCNSGTCYTTCFKHETEQLKSLQKWKRQLCGCVLFP